MNELQDFYNQYLTETVIEVGTELKQIKDRAMKYVVEAGKSPANRTLLQQMMKDYDDLRYAVSRRYELKGCACMIARMYVVRKR